MRCFWRSWGDGGSPALVARPPCLQSCPGTQGPAEPSSGSIRCPRRERRPWPRGTVTASGPRARCLPARPVPGPAATSGPAPRSGGTQDLPFLCPRAGSASSVSANSPEPARAGPTPLRASSTGQLRPARGGFAFPPCLGLRAHPGTEETRLPARSRGLQAPPGTSARRFVCPSPETGHGHAVCPKMACNFGKLCRGQRSLPNRQAGPGSWGWGVIQSRLGSRRDAAGKGASPRFWEAILQPPGQAPRSEQGTPCLGRLCLALLPLPSPAQPSSRDGAGCSSPAMPPALPCSTGVLPDHRVKARGCPAGPYLLSPALAT